MKSFWNLLGFAVLAVCLGGILPLLVVVVLIAGVAGMVGKTAEEGLDESARRVQKELDLEPDPIKAQALCGLVQKMELHRAHIQTAALAIAVGAALVLGNPIIPFLGWLVWMTIWRLRYRRQFA